MSTFNDLFKKREKNKEFKLKNYPEGLTKFKSRIEFIFISLCILTLIFLAGGTVLDLLNQFKIITLINCIVCGILFYLFIKLFKYSLRKLKFIKIYNEQNDKVEIDYQQHKIFYTYHTVFYTQNNEIPFLKLQKIIFDKTKLEAKVISRKNYFSTFYIFKFTNQSEYEKFQKEIQKCVNKSYFSKDFTIR